MATINKPTGVIISKNAAADICANFHSGQWSALYSFASSKSYVYEKHNEYMNEIDKVKTSTVKGKSELKKLKKFFDYKHWEATNK